MIRLPRKVRPEWGVIPDNADPLRLSPEDWIVEELTDGQAADLIVRQRRQIADLKEQVEKAEWRMSSLSASLTRAVDERAALVEEMKSLRKRLKAEERAERAKAHRLVPIRYRRHIDHDT